MYRNESAHSYYEPRKSSFILVQKNCSEGVNLKDNNLLKKILLLKYNLIVTSQFMNQNAI